MRRGCCKIAISPQLFLPTENRALPAACHNSFRQLYMEVRGMQPKLYMKKLKSNRKCIAFTYVCSYDKSII